MRIALRTGLLAFALSVAWAASAAAQVPRALIGDLACIPKNGHPVAQAVAGPVTNTDEVRIYFRRHGYGAFYWVPARPTPAGRLWGALRAPDPDNKQAEVSAAVVAPTGQPRAQSRIISVPVEPNSRVQLGNAQQAAADHLIVGETSL